MKKLESYHYIFGMKKKYLWMLLSAFICIGARAAVYPTESYQLSANGDTLVRWLGHEAEVDLSGDPAFTNVKCIGERAFWQNDSLKYFGSSDCLESISTLAFESCEALSAVYIGPNVKSIEPCAFFYSPVLKHFTVDERNTCYSVRGTMLFDMRSSTLVASGYEESKEVVIPKGTKAIGDYAFYLSDITSLSLPEELQHIGSNAFGFAEQLTAAHLPQGIESVGEAAFYACDRLESITLPASLQSLGSVAFAFCPSIKSVVAQSITPLVIPTIADDNVFYYSELSAATLYVPEESIEQYKATDGWKNFPTIVGVPKPSAKTLIVIMTDGSQSEFQLESQPKVYNRGTSLEIISRETTISLPLQQLKQMTFRPVDSAQGIDEVKVDEQSPREFINFSQLPPRSKIEIYTLDGRLLKSESVPDTSRALSLDELGRGMFVVRINGVTYKISRK